MWRTVVTISPPLLDDEAGILTMYIVAGSKMWSSLLLPASKKVD
jgi:hypothetical protein